VLISVALPLGLFRTFTYEASDADAARARPGMRAVVPFRARKMLGVIVGPAESNPRITPKRVVDLPDAEPVISEELLALCRWIADYYVAPLGVVIRTALPAALGSVARAQPAQKSHRVARIARELPSLMERDTLFARAPQQRAAYELLESLGGAAAVEHLIEKLACSPSVLTRLATRGFIEISAETVARDPFASRAVPPAAPHEPSAAQRAAIETAAAGQPGQVFLLHGVTGSG
jgi:primosomal protein N' (replication factor Y)